MSLLRTGARRMFVTGVRRCRGAGADSRDGADAKRMFFCGFKMLVEA
ncbi:hypothetical protein MQC88_01115 [Luteimonas sp. 50]|uniref:Uncharacterized protein n=1 Tax=Cognatiluteimonas sedimenti TaxID=2927791 RepID=A0ABT0A0R6_9GAMM|nr:hypothetical protein [Lysobacter sedimenti]MCJ0824571.1 hypothetical protein [Lysobacter sedimenti]